MRFRVDQGHHVLQLIAESKRASRLIVAAARPKTAGDRLIQQPAIGKHIERLIGGLHMDRSQRMCPMMPNGFQRRTACRRPSEATNELTGILSIFSNSQPEGTVALLTDGEVEGQLNRATRIQSGPHFPGQS